jgi:hypothetical protein
MPSHLIPSSLPLRSLVLAVVVALLPVASPLAGADAVAAPEVPIISLDAKVQKDLANLDRLLASDPKLEEKLRNNIDQLSQEKFLAENPDIGALVKKQPTLPASLKTERHYFVNRQVARLAADKVTRKDALALDEFLTAHPDISKALIKKPNLIVDANFLIANPSLAKFLETHPSLSSVLLKRSDKKSAKEAPKK